MRLVDFVMLIDNSSFTQTETFRRIEMDLRDAIDHVRWPPNGPDFAIYPESGKKRNEGNGVRPIKIGFQTLLQERGWRLEQRYPGVQDEVRPGAFDAWIELTDDGFSPFVMEWETGNISSSHRALNKMATGLQEGFSPVESAAISTNSSPISSSGHRCRSEASWLLSPSNMIGRVSMSPESQRVPTDELSAEPFR